MTRVLDGAPLPRCLAVWLLATAALVALGGWLAPDVAVAAGAAAGGHGPVPFDQALVSACELVLLGCGSWLWLVTGLVCADAARGVRVRRRGVPPGVRRLLLACCGVALASTLTAPAGATPPAAASGGAAGDRSTSGTAVQGLRLPDRPTAAGHLGLLLARQARVAVTHDVVTVRPGDSLWELAVADLPAGADDAAVARRWREIYRANRDLIGPDPDLIRPHQRLRLPRP